MATIDGFKEAILLSVAFVLCVSVIVAVMNVDYAKNFSAGFTDNTNSETAFIRYSQNSQNLIEGGEAVFNAEQGITLKSSWGIAKDAISIVWSFMSGGWIENVVDAMNLGEAGTIIAKVMRIIYVTSLVSALIYMLFKVVL